MLHQALVDKYGRLPKPKHGLIKKTPGGFDSADWALKEQQQKKTPAGRSMGINPAGPK